MPTFEQAVEKVIAIHEPNWKDGARSAEIWRSSLRDYALPRLGRKPVNKIATSDVLAVLVPIWAEKRETARRVRQRIGAVMKWAIAEGHREDNPAGEAIGAALPKNGTPRKHQMALPHGEVGEALRKVAGIQCLASYQACFRVPGVDGSAIGRGTGRKVGGDRPRSPHLTLPGERIKEGFVGHDAVVAGA